jgi:hypothetical protein
VLQDDQYLPSRTTGNAAPPAAGRPGDDRAALAAALRDLADSQETTAHAVRAIADSLEDAKHAHRWADELIERAAFNRQSATILEQQIGQ